MVVPTIAEGISDEDIVALTIRAFEKGRAAAMTEVAGEINRRARRISDRERKIASGKIQARPSE